MPENTTVENVSNAPDVNVSPAADAQEPVEEVVISAESSAPAQTDSEKSVVTNPPADVAQPQSQKDIDKAFGQRLAHERQKYEQSDAYRLGSMILEDRARRDGITPAEAFQRIQEERLDATAEAYAKDQKQFYKDLLKNNLGRPSNPSPIREDPRDQARRVGEAIAEMNQRGTLPAGFDIQKDLDQATYDDIVQYGPEAAMRMWEMRLERPDPAIAELQRRQAGPAPMRPTSGASQQSAPTDFSKLTTEEYRKKQAEINRAILDGKRVRLS